MNSDVNCIVYFMDSFHGGCVLLKLYGAYSVLHIRGNERWRLNTVECDKASRYLFCMAIISESQSWFWWWWWSFELFVCFICLEHTRFEMVGCWTFLDCIHFTVQMVWETTTRLILEFVCCWIYQRVWWTCSILWRSLSLLFKWKTINVKVCTFCLHLWSLMRMVSDKLCTLQQVLGYAKSF